MARYTWGLTAWVILTIFSSPGCAAESTQNKVCFKEQCVRVEVVQNKEEVARGLQFRNSLGVDEGMLFIFPYPHSYNFWMKDTWIPLDIIWLDSSRRVVHIEKNVPPCQSDPCPIYVPSGEALYVLEVNALGADRRGVQVGDFAEFLISN